MPYAIRQVLNDLAFETRKVAQANLPRQMILRNKWTERSVAMEKATGFKVDRMESATGSLQQYMATQEFGGIEKKQGKEGVVIPTSVASGEGRGKIPRRRLPTGGRRLVKIKLQHRRDAARNKKQDLLLRVQEAVNSGRRDFFFDFGGGRKKGIFRVRGGEEGVKRGWPKGAKIDLIYDMTNQAVDVPRNPWLQPARDKAVQRRDEFYARALAYQLRRLR